MNKGISCFEEILNINESTIKQTFLKLHTIDIVKAFMGASPEVNILINSGYD